MKGFWESLPADLPLTTRPYRDAAESMGMTEEDLIARLEDLKRQGYIRRIAAAVSHRAAAYEGNAMVVWNVREGDIERVGFIMAEFPEVSHCYERDTGGYWPYNLYTMVHGRTNEECLATVSRMASKSGVEDYLILSSIREFKKTSFSVRNEEKHI